MIRMLEYGRWLLPDGRDYYFSDPGHVPDGIVVLCGVCGADCKEERGVMDARSWTMAMAGKKEKFDKFICPHTWQGWHNQSRQLLCLAEDTPSPTLKEIYTKDARKIITSGLVDQWKSSNS